MATRTVCDFVDPGTDAHEEHPAQFTVEAQAKSGVEVRVLKSKDACWSHVPNAWELLKTLTKHAQFHQIVIRKVSDGN